MIVHEIDNTTQREAFGGVFITDHPASGYTNSYVPQCCPIPLVSSPFCCLF